MQGETIKFYRKRNNYSQEKLAELLGVSRQAVAKWENEISLPSTENMIKIADIFHISTDELIKGQKEVTITSQDKGSNLKKTYKIILGIMVAFIVFVLLLRHMLPGAAQKINGLFIVMNLAILMVLLSIIIYIVVLVIAALKKYITS